MTVQSSNLQFNRKKRRSSPVLLVLALTTAASFAIAGVWQLLSPAEEEDTGIVFDPAIAAAYGKEPSAASAETESSTAAEESDSSSAAESISASTASEEPSSTSSEPGESAAAGSSGLTYLSDARPLAEQPERVKSSYFDDAVFIGDSITTGITLYDVMSNATVWASTGASLSNILTREIATVDGVAMTVPEALKIVQPGKIYLLLGANSLAADLEDVITVYSSVLDTIRAAAPNALLYVQSAFPINEELYAVKYNTTITNAVIDDFNSRLLKLCGEKNVYFLDLNSYFRDESGGLPKEDTSDGLHIHSAQYLDWFDYLKTHAVQE